MVRHLIVLCSLFAQAVKVEVELENINWVDAKHISIWKQHENSVYFGGKWSLIFLEEKELALLCAPLDLLLIFAISKPPIALSNDIFYGIK